MAYGAGRCLRWPGSAANSGVLVRGEESGVEPDAGPMVDEVFEPWDQPPVDLVERFERRRDAGVLLVEEFLFSSFGQFLA